MTATGGGGGESDEFLVFFVLSPPPPPPAAVLTLRVCCHGYSSSDRVTLISGAIKRIFLCFLQREGVELLRAKLPRYRIKLNYDRL